MQYRNANPHIIHRVAISIYRVKYKTFCASIEQFTEPVLILMGMESDEQKNTRHCVTKEASLALCTYFGGGTQIWVSVDSRN